MAMDKKLAEFDLEVFFAKWEFEAEYLMCCSDAESMSMSDMIDLADEEALLLWNSLQLGYTESQGLPLLREEIAKQYPGLAGENVFCFAGAEEGIYAAMRSMLKKEDHVVVVTPCYQSLKSVADVLCQVSSVDLLQEESWRLDLDQLAAVMKSNTKMVVVNFPHNPTGALISEEEQDRLISLCREKGAWLFSDEVYRGIEISEDVKRLPTAASKYEKGMSLGVMSKALGLAGLRVGWIASQDKKALETLASYKHYLSICNSAPSEILSLIALRNQDKILAKNTAIVRHNFALLQSLLDKWSHLFDWTPPKAGCCGFVRYKGDGGSNNNNNVGDFMPMALNLVEQHGVLTLPGGFFPCEPARDRPYIDHFRVGFGRKNFPEVLEKFDAALRALEATEGESRTKRQRTKQ